MQLGNIFTLSLFIHLFSIWRKKGVSHKKDCSYKTVSLLKNNNTGKKNEKIHKIFVR